MLINWFKKSVGHAPKVFKKNRVWFWFQIRNSLKNYLNSTGKEKIMLWFILKLFDFFVDRFNLNLNLEFLDISDIYWLNNDKVFHCFQYQFLPFYWISGMRIQYYRMSWNRMVCQLTKSTSLIVMKSTWVTTLKVCEKLYYFPLKR